ncbi:phospholipase A2 inhibitor gamma subunit B-like isoform X2 [Emydura macquarii macquarii]|uniref:phospholipase A2 inhibitor gamma subunit B-like isoform X2 n=1 Tax=Emydura macquarii macquarii TaxID=1129001 RepID=UPI00352A3A60
MGELLSLCVLAALLGTGGAISCYNCTSSEGYNCTTSQASCTATVNSCITIAHDEEQGDEDKEKTVYEKKCNSDDRLCNQFYGLTAGAYRLRWNSTCCRADRCNMPEITLQPSAGIPNGLQCHSCFVRGSDVCVPSEVLNCTGLQTRCIHFSTTAGTGSALLCEVRESKEEPCSGPLQPCTPLEGTCVILVAAFNLCE